MLASRKAADATGLRGTRFTAPRPGNPTTVGRPIDHGASSWSEVATFTVTTQAMRDTERQGDARSSADPINLGAPTGGGMTQWGMAYLRHGDRA